MGGRSLGDDMVGAGGMVAIWLLTRIGGKADRAEGAEMAGGEGRGNHTGRTTRSPLLPSGRRRRRRPVCATLQLARR